MNITLLRLLVEKLKLARRHIFLAAAIVGLGVLLLPHERGRSEWVDEARRAIAGALLATGTVSLLYDYLFVRRVIGGYFELLKTATSLELDRLYGDRLEAMEDIAEELQRAYGNVKIICVSGSDFFGQGRAAKAIANLIERRQNVHLRFLLLKPTNRYAFLRSWIEEKYTVAHEDQEQLDKDEIKPIYSRDDFRTSTMQARIDTAQSALRNISKALKEPTRLSVRFYSYQPSLFLVAVNRWLFIEPYNWGVDRYYVPDAVEPCIAKRVLVLKFRRGSFNGMIFENHFDRLWKCHQTERFLPAVSPTETDAKAH